MKSVKKILGIGLISVTALSLSGCGLIPLPDEERYSRINQIKNAIDLESAGSIIKEEYSGDGVWSGSSYSVTIRGNDSFKKISSQLLSAVDSPDSCAVTSNSISCISNNNPTATMSTDGEITSLNLNDTLGGRNGK